MILVRTDGALGEKSNWRQQALRLAGALLGGLVCLSAQCAPAADESFSSAAPKGWLDKVQTYCMVPVLPETAEALHVTVNGVWGGIGGTQPLLTNPDLVPEVEAKYGDDVQAFVDACHRAGLIVPGVVNGIEGFTTMRAVWPNLDAMACWDAAGKPAQVSDEMLLMCVNNPDWQQWELDWGKRAIDEGADLVMLDTPMSASFVSGFLKAGFCPHCLGNLKQYLENKYTEAELKERFGLETFESQQMIARLAPLQDLSNPANRPHHNTSQDDLLFREFIYCQEQASFDTRKQLITGLREYAAAQGRQVAFATNASDLGTVNPGGHWVRALMFADLFDLFVYEQNVEPVGMMSDQAIRYPRGKWVAYHKLAHAIHHRRAPAVLHSSQMDSVLVDVLIRGFTTNTRFAVQSAEAYAANGAYVEFYVSPSASVKQQLLDKCWKGAAEHAEFVLSHRDLYEGELRSGSPLALVFLYNERGRTIPAVYPSYLGFAQALAEGNYPFDVVFAGDGHYVQDRLAASDLAPYRVLLVPSPIAPTLSQQQVVRDYVASGGTLVCQEPEALGLSATLETQDPDMPACIEGQFSLGKGQVLVLRGEVSPTWTDDVGSNYFRNYQPEHRTEIGQLADALGVEPTIPGGQDGLVTAYPVLQPEAKRLVVHLVNCDIDYEKDSIREKAAISVRVVAPGFLGDQMIAQLYVPGKAPESLEVLASGGRISFTVPRLGSYASLVLTSQEP